MNKVEKSEVILKSRVASLRLMDPMGKHDAREGTGHLWEVTLKTTPTIQSTTRSNTTSIRQTMAAPTRTTETKTEAGATRKGGVADGEGGKQEEKSNREMVEEERGGGR